MTPREKAKEIAKRFIGHNRTPRAIIPCATIVVDEIIESLKVTTGHLNLSSSDVNEVDKDLVFWQDVRKEIEKL